MTGAASPGRGGGDVIRQLASAHASYLLFPGDTEQPAFRSAAERVAATAETALTGGPVHAQVRSARFHTRDGELRHDETVERLGLACFDRLIEHLRVHAVPSPDELAAFSELLSLPVDEVMDRGGASAVLRAMGVTSIAVGEAREDEDDAAELEGLTADQLLLWEQLQDPGSLAAALMIEGMPGEPAAAAHDLYVRFRAIEGILPTRLAARRDFFVRIRQVLSHLPNAVDREFHAIVLTRLASERFAMSFGVNLTDQELVDTLFDLSAYGGPDPMDLGRRIVAMTDRKGAVLDLIAAHGNAVTSELATMAEGESATLVALALSEANEAVRTAVADVLAEQLVDASSADAVAVRELYPDSEEDRRTLALASFRDYLAAEDRRVSVDRVLDVWAGAVRSALVAGDERLVDRLLDVLETAIPPDADVFKRHAAARARAAVATPELVRTLLGRRGEDVPVESVAVPLLRFGADALEAVLDVLAVEESASSRSGLTGLAAALAPGHLDALAGRIDDDRWYVVRNLVTIMGRLGPDDDALVVLVGLVDHADPGVRREVVRSLVACAGEAAVPYLRRMATDPAATVATAARQALAGVRADVAARALADLARHGTGGEERRAVLDALAGHPSPEVPDLLADLASRQAGPRLPGPLRRHARRLARSRTASGR